MLKQPSPRCRASSPVRLLNRTGTDAVLTRACEDLIHRTFESLVGVRRAVVHFYNPTTPVMRRVVLGMHQEQIVELATTHASAHVHHQPSFHRRVLAASFSRRQVSRAGTCGTGFWGCFASGNAQNLPRYCMRK